MDLPFHDTPGRWARLPGVRSNWSARASLGAYLGLRPQRRGAGRRAVPHAGHVPVLGGTDAPRAVGRLPGRDAPAVRRPGRLLRPRAQRQRARWRPLKKRLNERAFRAARHLVAWSQWAKDSLVADYGVPADKITVIPPGIDTARWDFPARRPDPQRPVNLLFVGGDFARKGGDTLLEAFAAPAAPARRPPARRHQDATGWGTACRASPSTAASRPTRSALLRLFAEADLFVFPTRGDCLPLAVMEALAAGLPVVTTDVAALPEAVTHGETGWIVPPDDPPALADALAA